MKADYYLECPGAQVTSSERGFLVESARTFSDIRRPVFVNIGVMWGCTVHCLRAGHGGARIVALDIEYSWRIKYQDDLNVEWITADSRTYPWKGPIDLLLIDGDHHYNVLTKDIGNWVPHVGVGGLVIFHDYAPSKHNLAQFPELADVRRAVGEWRERENRMGYKWHSDRADSMISFRRIT